MNINIQGSQTSIYGGNLLSNRGLKSTQQKMERQAQRDSQIAFYEERKLGLKNMKCDTVEEIAKKLDLFHTYEDQIVAAKATYNSEQMWHMLDESREIGEKIAEAAEKAKPKTPEERMEDLVEEAMGVESDGMMEELQEAVEEVLEEVEEVREELEEVLPEEKETAAQVQDVPTDEAAPPVQDVPTDEKDLLVQDISAEEKDLQIQNISAEEMVLQQQDVAESVKQQLQMPQNSVLTPYSALLSEKEADRFYSPVDIRL